ncbi:MAG TPA: DUF5615 family PIN-like protein [Verrucomicrobiae bacterium]|jgi:hypothetical protein
MRVLLDECVPRPFGRRLAGHTFSTVPKEGWSAFKNGKLLALAQARFDVLLTTDKGIRWQQSVIRFNIAVVVMRARSNTLEDLEPLLPALLGKLPFVVKGQATFIGDE